ncbi:anthranilate synthase component I family protein [Candidatus Woesearchaeota archaeon]|nr:anthranilate synthase component I family protein [Candidatus Woesearchaeota archaeon]
MFIKELGFKDPCEAYEKLRDINSVLLESQKNGRHSYIALNPYMVFKSKGEKIEITENGEKRVKRANPINELKSILCDDKRKAERKEGWPLFYSGCIGYMGYDTVHLFERLPRKAKDDLKLPDIYMIFPRDILFFDHKRNVMKIICESKEDCCRIVRKLDEAGNRPKRAEAAAGKKRPIEDKGCNFRSNFTFEEYKKAIKRCKDYVKAGDSFQIKISQRFECKIREDSFEIYKRLRRINPSPYAAYVHLDGCTLVSCSPEHLVKVEKGEVETRPIGGTYPRGNDEEEDNSILRRFKRDDKERAEHTMLIDLERNDLGKVCRYGSIKVNECRSIEKYSHLMHIVTNIKGELEEGKDIFDVLRAMFPGGTITGCPKIRTMEIIDEIENRARGPYTGSIGFMNFSNEMDLNIIIRTMVIKGSKGFIQSGGGIVADSTAKREYDETIDKAKALFEAIGR